jgi:hypothetical protein
MHTKKDNPYYSLPPEERRKQVCENYELFKDVTTSTEVESKEEVRKLIEFYKKIQLSEHDLNREAFRAKAEYWRKELMKPTNDPDTELQIAKALENSTRLAEEFRLKGEMETGDDVDSSFIYLFEIPEDKKPHHLRMKL